MSRFTLTCPECHAEVSLSARRLTVRIDEGTATAGEAMFTCLSCHATVSPGAQLTVPWNPEFSAFAYVLTGRGNAGAEGRPVESGRSMLACRLALGHRRSPVELGQTAKRSLRRFDDRQSVGGAKRAGDCA